MGLANSRYTIPSLPTCFSPSAPFFFASYHEYSQVFSFYIFVYIYGTRFLCSHTFLQWSFPITALTNLYVYNQPTNVLLLKINTAHLQKMKPLTSVLLHDQTERDLAYVPFYLFPILFFFFFFSSPHPPLPLFVYCLSFSFLLLIGLVKFDVCTSKRRNTNCHVNWALSGILLSSPNRKSNNFHLFFLLSMSHFYSSINFCISNIY